MTVPKESMLYKPLCRPPGASYPRPQSGFVNLNSEDFVRKGKFPSGAHSDLGHPEVGWALLRCAGIDEAQHG